VNGSAEAKADANAQPNADANADANANAGALADADADANAGANANGDASADALALFRGTPDALISVSDFDAASPFARYAFAPSPGHFNDGNVEIARHAISRRACLDGLRDVVLQTPAQRATCGADNMVPIWRGADAGAPKTCIDIFEFPNKACELPMVWGSPAQAEAICEAQSKRLCKQEEWNLACAGDPEGGKDRVYAYGDTLDYEICNSNKPHELGELTPWGTRYWKCNVQSADSAWKTCGTDTEPSGAFPHCRSRFGVFDQHGNVAEMMSRKEGDVVYTQLKGSAFFYVDVGRSHDAPPSENKKMSGGQMHDTYPDGCSFDPRWHVEVLSQSMHVNYHLGFRCCKSL
jgi:hypothetical protein